MGLGGAVPARAGAEVKQLVLDTVDEAVAAGLAHRWATALWRVSDDRVHRWRARRAERGGGLEDRRRGGAAAHALLPQEADAILEIAEQWGPTDRSHRKLAHRGSYENSVWVSPSTFRRVLDANGLIVAQASEPAAFSISTDTRTATFDGAPFPLDFDPELAASDAALMIEYFTGFEGFAGTPEEVRELQEEYFAFWVWLYFSPFMCDLRTRAAHANRDVIRYERVAVLYGKANCGKTSLIQALLRSMSHVVTA